MADDLLQKFRSAQFGIFTKNPDFMQEMKFVQKYYEFYQGTPDHATDPGDEPFGQEWKIPGNLDYTPSKDIRNHVKKLILKQGRFMFGVAPNLILKPLAGNKTDKIEDKRTLLETILTDAGFWAQTQKAFIDSTIGKRVLLTIIANPGEEIRFRYYTMPEFTYSVDPNDSSRLVKVSIVYQDDRTKGAISGKQIWHQWIYELLENPLSGETKCFATYKVTDGDDNLRVVDQPVVDDQGMEIMDPVTGEPMIVKKECIEQYDTGLDFIPAYVILNDGLTGDTKGSSDVKDLMQMATHYNRTNSDYRDALRFKMFEQPVFVDADDDSIASIKIAPNGLINLKSDPTAMDPEGGSTTAQYGMLSSTFNFADPAEKYLDRLKKDMYEYMDQPLPEQVAAVPSAKALGYLFYDLKARCEQKWNSWDAALQWLVDKIENCILTFDLYPEAHGAQIMSVPSVLTIEHNYPIPEDEDEKRKTAISEVEANVKSHKTYIREYGNVEDEDAEWQEIIEEQGEINDSTGASFATGVNNQIQQIDGEDEENKDDKPSIIDDGQVVEGGPDDSGR